MFIANDVVDVLRGTRRDEEGDEVDDDRPTIREIPISILPRSVTVLNPASGRVEQVVTLNGRVAPDADIRKGDRIRSRRTGMTFAVEEVLEFSFAPIATPKMLVLRDFGDNA